MRYIQAVGWISRHEGAAIEGRIRQQNDPDVLKQLELALQFGYPFVLDNLAEYVDPTLDPILLKATTFQACSEILRKS